MHISKRHRALDMRFRELLAEADLPEPDESAFLTRAIVFVWYETKALVLIDLEELPEGEDALDGLDLNDLAIDVSGAFEEAAGRPDFADTC